MIRDNFLFFYDYVSNMKNYCSIDRLLENVKVLPVGKGNIPTAPLYSDTKKWEFFERKKKETKKKEHAFKDLASNYNVEILNCFYPELQVKYTESEIKNKLKLLSEFRGFKFVTTLVLVFKKVESKDKTK